MAEILPSATPPALRAVAGAARAHTVGRQVRVPKTAELVATALRRRIIQGDLGPGDALPSESELMAVFGVSRPTLREAFRVLESESLIDIRRGVRGGARVNAPDPLVAARYSGLVLEYRGTTLADVYQASSMIEPPCVRLLASTRTAADIARLREVLEAENVVLGEPLALVEAQDAFHRLVVELTRNETMILLVGILRSIVDRANDSHTAADDSPATRAQARKGHRAHARLVDLIEAGDGEEAERLWLQHIAATHDVVNAADPKTVLDLLD